MRLPFLTRRDDEFAPLQEAARQFQALQRALESSGHTLTDLLLAIDQAGFERIGGETPGPGDIPTPTREALVRRSRLYWQFEPVPDRIIALWTEYAFGRGWTIAAEDGGFQRYLDIVLAARHNRRQFSRTGWQRNSNALLVDGERWFGYWVGASVVRVRNFDPLQIVEVLTNPDDRDEIWYYRRTWEDAQGRRFTRFYRDWDFVDEAGNPRNDAHPRMRPDIPGAGTYGDVRWEPEPGVWVSYLTINTLGLRGYPLLTSSFDWNRAYREFMRDRSALNAARAQFAWKGKVKGGKGAVERIASAFDTPSPLSPGEGLRTPRAATFWENEGVELQQVSMQTDGASATHDARALRIMAALPGGMPDYMLGDTGNANLATAKAMERPIETMFAAYQDLWAEYVQDMAYHVARWFNWAGSYDVVIETPDILAREPWEMARGYAELVRSVPAVGVAPQPIAMLLRDMGVDDVDGAMAVIEPLLGMPAVTDEDEAAAIEAVREAVRG